MGNQLINIKANCKPILNLITILSHYTKHWVLNKFKRKTQNEEDKIKLDGRNA